MAERLKRLIVLLSLLIPFAVSAQAQNPTLFSWINPTTNTDGSALTDLAGTVIRCGTRSRAYDLVSVTVNDSTVTTLLIASVVTADGQYFCAAFSFNVPGLESIPSNEVMFVILGARPPPVPPPSATAPSAPTEFTAE